MSSTAIPEFPLLSTSRLTLRAVTREDAEPFRALLSIPEVTRFSNWPDRPSKAEGAKFARNMAKAFRSGNGCAWIIEERASHALIGAIRFNYFIKPWQCGGLGYESHPDFWGRGLMTEAVRAVVACGHEAFALNRIEAWTMDGNGASDRVLEKAGFRYEGTARKKAWFKGAYHDCRMFGRIAGDPIG